MSKETQNKFQGFFSKSLLTKSSAGRARRAQHKIQLPAHQESLPGPVPPKCAFASNSNLRVKNEFFNI